MWQYAGMGFLLLILMPLALGFWAQRHVNGTFERWAQVRVSSGLTGARVARAILDRHGLHDVPVELVQGQLTDHYDPRRRSVHLSPVVYEGDSVSSISVAAHEVGHALQHSRGYAPLAARTAFFPLAAFGGGAFNVLILAGVVMFFVGLAGPGMWAALIGIGLYSFAVLFHIVTLPVEFNASSRARVQLVELGAIAPQEQDGVGKVLNAAAMTYVVAALASIATLLYYASWFLGGDD